MRGEENKNEEHWQLLVLLLKEICQERGISQQELAKLTGMPQGNVSRFFSLKYCPNMRTFLEFARALELNLFFEAREGKSDLNKAFEKAMEALGRRPGPLLNN